jgi:tetratricopeptide (TPR) repeat protein
VQVALTAALALLAACSGRHPPGDAPVEIDASRYDPEVAALFARLVEEAKRDPAAADPRGRLGMAYEANDLPERAVESYEQATRLEPSEPRWWYHAAIVLFAQGEAARAVASMDSAIARDDRYAPAHWRRGNWLLAIGELDEAERSFRRAAELEPDHPAGWLGLARLRLQEDEAEEAEALLLEAIERRPQSPFVPYLRQLLGIAYRRMGRLDDARAQLAKGRAGRLAWADSWHDEIDEYRVSLGATLRKTQVMLATGRSAEAVATLRELRAVRETNRALLEQLGVGYIDLGELEKAREVLEACIEHHPDDASSYVNLSLVELASGSVVEARRLVEKGLELNPKLASGYSRRGEILERLGRTEEALASFEEALLLEPANPEHLAAAADAAAKLRRFDEAAAFLDRAIEQNPSDAALISARETVERRRRRP